MDDIGSDNADEPIAIPQPAQSLKRSARTKIRKSNLQGTGGGHRFASTRRGKVFAAAPDRYIPPYDSLATSAQAEASEHEPSVPPAPQSMAPPRASFSDTEERDMGRPLSFSEEAAIYDSYADRASFDQDDVALGYAYQNMSGHTSPILRDPPAPELDPREIRPLSAPPTTPAPLHHVLPPQQQSVMHHPSPRHHLPVPAPAQGTVLTRSPSPGSMSDSYAEIHSMSSTPSPSPAGRRKELEKQKEKEKEKEKEKKSGIFGKGKVKKDKPSKPSEQPPREKEKETSFFGNWFGGKKKNDEPVPVTSGMGPATAAALLGQSRSKAGLATQEPPGQMGYARYPIHVERAVYRLSHIKLANPRRPLHEQVLISNLMFWYLGVINKPATPQPGQTPAQNQSVLDAAVGSAAAAPADEQEMEPLEEVHLEQEQRLAAEREQQEQAVRRELGPPRKGLNKPPSGGDGRLAARKAEIPVKGPQYGINMVIEQGVGYDVQEQSQRNTTPPTHVPAGYDYSHDETSQRVGATADQQYHDPRTHRSLSPQPAPYSESNPYPIYDQSQQQSPRNSARSPPPITRQPPRSPPSSLPPGAMPPVNDPSHSWVSQTQQMSQQTAQGRPPSVRSVNNQPQDYEQYYEQPSQSQRARPVPSVDTSHPDSRQKQQPQQRPIQQQSPQPARNRTASYSASNNPPNSSRPKTSPADPPSAKLQGRSLSASAVPSEPIPRSRSPPPGPRPRARSRSRTRDDVPSAVLQPPLPVNGGVRAVRQEDRQRKAGSGEEEDLPLAVYQRQQQQQHQQPHPHPQYYPQQYPQVRQTQEHDWTYSRR